MPRRWPCVPHKRVKYQRQGLECEDTLPALESHPELAEPAWKQSIVTPAGHIRNPDLLQKTRISEIPNSSQISPSPPDIPYTRINKERQRLTD